MKITKEEVEARGFELGEYMGQKAYIRPIARDTVLRFGGQFNGALELELPDGNDGYITLVPNVQSWEDVEALAWNEGRNRYYMRWAAKTCPALRGEVEALYRGLILQVAAYLRVPMTYEQAAKKAAERIHEPDCVDPAGAFCFLPGYHTNGHTDTDKEREEHFMGTICGIARGILRERRPWYRHPRWHFWHWDFQIHSVQRFKRWAFSKCAGCGKGFTWGYSPISHQWDNDGPRWFRGERGIYHSGCDSAVYKPAQGAEHPPEAGT